MKTVSSLAFAWIVAASTGCGGGGGSGTAGLPQPVRGPQDAGQPTDMVVGEPSDAGSITFEEVSTRVGITGLQGRGAEPCNPFIGSGGAWGDVDLDGDQDLFATNHGGPDYLYLNQGDLDGDRLPDFTEVAGALGIQSADHYSHSANFIDYDNDGDPDLYVTSQNKGNTLFRNDRLETGTLGFTDVTAFAGVEDEGRAVTSAWGDLDRDGFLDFYLAKHAKCFFDADPQPPDRLYHARGDGTFEDWSRYLCADGTTRCRDVVGLGFTAAFLDSDNDGDPDLYLVNDSTHGGGPNRHWRNDGPDGHGGWLLPEISAQLGTNTRVNGMGLGVGDIDNDGWLDLAFSNIEESHVLRNLGNGQYEDITYSCGIYAVTAALTGWGTAFLDADNDGWLDLYFVNGPIWGELQERNTFYRGEGNLVFTEMTLAAGLEGLSKSRSIAMADFDLDGFVDLFVGNLFQQPYLYRNATPRRLGHQNWLKVTVEGTTSNRDGIGSRITLVAGNQRLTREISSGSAHGGGDEHAAFFGLGDATSGLLRVRWPSGIETTHGQVSAGQHVHLVEPAGTSLFEGRAAGRPTR